MTIEELVNANKDMSSDDIVNGCILYQDCQLRELCYLLDSYDNDIRKELALRKQD